MTKITKGQIKNGPKSVEKDVTVVFEIAVICETGKDGEKYGGFTDDIESRLRYDNSGRCKHTFKFIPWRIKAAVAFTNHQKTLAFEKYLKTSSGRAFMLVNSSIRCCRFGTLSPPFLH